MTPSSFTMSPLRLRAIARSLALLAILALALPLPSQDAVDADDEAPAPTTTARITTHAKLGESGRKVFERQEHNHLRRVEGYEPLPYARWKTGDFADYVVSDRAQRTGVRRLNGWNAMRQFMPAPERLPEPAPNKRGVVSNAVFGSRWVTLGPSRVDNGQPTYPNGQPRLKVSGRIACVAVDPTDSDIMYLGGAQGGVWKTTDGGRSWVPKTDHAPSLAMGHIDVHPTQPNIVWAGTGEHHFSNDSFYGAGLLVSVDAGESWTHRPGPSGELVGSFISRVAIDRADPSGNTLLIASSDGLFRTTDGGVSTLTLISSGQWTDIQQDILTPTVWYAARMQDGIYKSTTNGASFTPVAPGLTSYSVGRIHLGQSPPDAGTDTVLYAVVVEASNSIRVYHSPDQGVTWTPVTGKTESYNRGSQYWYDIYIAVSKTDSNKVSIGGVRCYTTADGGATWQDAADGKNTHDDHHFGLFVSSDEGEYLFDCNDGGIFRSNDLGATWESMNESLGLLMFESIEPSPVDEEFFIGGTQDNGIDTYNGTTVWTHVRGGDGGFVTVHPVDGRRMYGIYIYGWVDRSDEYGYDNTWYLSADGINGYDGSDTDVLLTSSEFLFYAPMRMNPTNPDQSILLGRRAWRTKNAGDIWSAAGALNSTIRGSALAYAPGNGNLVFAGFGNGDIQRSANILESDDALVTWSKIDAAPMPDSRITDLVVDASNNDRVLVTMARFGNPRVFVTNNATAASPTWIDATGNLPQDIPAQCAVIDSETGAFYIGTDLGVFRSIDDGKTWENFSTGLPTMAIYDLEIRPATNTLVAATHGRGAWRVARPALRVGSVSVEDPDRGNNGDGAIDVGEMVEVSLDLSNLGEEIATGATATLGSDTALVTVTGGAIAFGDIAAGSSATGATHWNVAVDKAATLQAGDDIRLTLHVSSDGGRYQRDLPLTLRVGVGAEVPLLNESFESGVLGGFTTAQPAGLEAWVVDATKASDGTRAAHSPSYVEEGVAILTSPVIDLPDDMSEIDISFDGTWYFEGNYFDGGVVEVSRNGGPFFDITTAQASILAIANGYDGAVGDSNPLGGGASRPAFTNGASGLPFSRTTLRLDGAVWSGQSLQFRWRVGFDEFSTAPQPSGWWIDNIDVVARAWSSTPPPTLQPTGVRVY